MVGPISVYSVNNIAYLHVVEGEIATIKAENVCIKRLEGLITIVYDQRDAYFLRDLALVEWYLVALSKGLFSVAGIEKLSTELSVMDFTGSVNYENRTEYPKSVQTVAGVGVSTDCHLWV